MTQFVVCDAAGNILRYGDVEDYAVQARNGETAVALAFSAIDPLSQRVDLATGALVAYQPPSPANDAMQTWGWDATTSRWLSTPTQAAQLAAAKAGYEAAAQSMLDTVAQAWSYDSLVSAASYATSTVAKFRAESAALVAWRDAVWSAAYALEAAVIAGTQPMPATVAAFVSLLPSAPAQPA